MVKMLLVVVMVCMDEVVMQPIAFPRLALALSDLVVAFSSVSSSIQTI